MEFADFSCKADWSEKLGLTELLQKALDEVREEPGV
jgi:hypothetical protein